MHCENDQHLGTPAANGDGKISGSIFDVEQVAGKRLVAGRTEFLIKWKGLLNSEITWEPEDNFSTCISKPQRRRESMEPLKTKKIRDEQNMHEEDAVVPDNRMAGSSQESLSEPTDSKACLEPEKIIMTDFLSLENGKETELYFYVKWRNCDGVGLIPARILNEACPQTVIAYYESILTWVTEP